MVDKRKTKPSKPKPTQHKTVSDAAIRSFAQKAGVKRVGKGVFDEFRKMLGA